MWLALSVLVVIGCLFLVLRPLLSPAQPWDAPRQETELDRLLDEKARTLRLLKDVEHDRSAGLLDEQVHSETRAEYLARAVRLNRRIAEITGVDVTQMAVEEPAS